MPVQSIGTPALWAGFLLLVTALLAFDLGVFNRRARTMSVRASLLYSLLWIGIAMLFNLFVYYKFGTEAGLQFLTGYLVEKALSVDNIFIFLVLFKYFAVPRVLQHRVLFFGIVGAVVMRGAFIWGGAILIEKFHWLTYLLGALLIYTGWKLIKEDPADIDPDKNRAVRLVKRFLPATESYEGKRFIVRQDGKYLITPLLLVLVAVETTDLVFAMDSIPAIFAITTDPFIVFTSNIFAILGLRALYFLLASMLEGLRYLRYGLSGALIFIGAKMLGQEVYHVSTGMSLTVIAVLLAVSIGSSVLFAKPHTEGPVTH